MAKEDYRKLSNDVVNYIKGIEKGFNMPLEVKFHYLSNIKQKKMIRFVQIPEQYSNDSTINADILVIVNEDFYDNFDEQTRKILIEKEFDRIEFNFEKGIIKLVTPKINVNSGFVAKHTWDKVDRAIKLEIEFEKQRKDKQ